MNNELSSEHAMALHFLAERYISLRTMFVPG